MTRLLPLTSSLSLSLTSTLLQRPSSSSVLMSQRDCYGSPNDRPLKEGTATFAPPQFRCSTSSLKVTTCRIKIWALGMTNKDGRTGEVLGPVGRLDANVGVCAATHSISMDRATDRSNERSLGMAIIIAFATLSSPLLPTPAPVNAIVSPT